ncbi:MAG: anthranilate synthase component I [Ignavibacteriae bacterium]|nr:anthranilate synthase component I [Ignavibacteriota bacterium]
MTFDEFKQLAQSYNVIPVSQTMLADMLTPVSAYLRLRKGSRSSFLFESVEGGERVARYSFIGRDPIAVLKCKENKTTLIENGNLQVLTENFFDILNRIVTRYRQPAIPSLPRFSGGLVGFIGYDAVRFIEEIPATVTNEINLDDSILGLFTSVIAFDHLKHQIIIIVNVIVDHHNDLRKQYEHAQTEIAKLESALHNTDIQTKRFKVCSDALKYETAPEAFHTMVKKAKHYIREGDIFQVVLSQRFSSEYEGDPFNTYRALRIINPSPYLYYLDLDGFSIIGSSPEILVRVEDGIAEVYPIAGTRHRGKNEEEDQALETELLADEKERAEHVMLVDLGRNDLGRVCDVGSIKVDQLMIIVRYSHVMHIASRVIGKVAAGKTCVDVLKATFPAGTVSGAPKIRAMKIIDELEGTRRGIYAGGVGYFDFSGNMDICIAIRTMFVTNGRIYLQAGAGIVADSDPEREYQETMNKAGALVEALKIAEEIN